jgi:tetratricopeptide (TPR) repeat protein
MVVGGYWLFVRPRVISVVVLADPTFKMHRGEDWRKLVAARFAEVDRIYSRQVGIAWKLVEDPDPHTTTIPGIDNRRRFFATDTGASADLVVEFAGTPEGARSASVVPFSHAAVIVDRAGKTERENSLVLAHELTLLFGAVDTKSTDNLMSPTPANDTLPPPTVRLIRQLRRYPFAHGIDSLQGDWDKRATTALTVAYADFSAHPTSLANRSIAAALIDEGKLAPAIVHLRAALKSDPTNAPARFELAEALGRDSQKDEALTVLREGVRLDPSLAPFHAGIGALLIGRNPEEAIDEFRAAIHLEPKNPAYYNALGRVLSDAMGQIDAAIAAFQDALKLAPGMAQAQRGLEAAQASKAKAASVAEILRQKARQSAQDPQVHYNLGVAEARAGNVAASSKAFEQAARLNPGLGVAHSSLALLLYVRGDFAGAWREVGLARAAGSEPETEFIAALTRKAPPPR